MGKQQNKDYYDSIFATQRESVRYQPPWPLQTEWYSRLQEVARLIFKSHNVLDLGCGFAILAGILEHTGHKGSYTGIDFAEETLQWVGDLHAVTPIHHDFLLLYRDLNHGGVPIMDDLGDTTVVMAEYLEHVEDDLSIFESIKEAAPNADIIITLPSFDDPGHVRWFETRQEIYNRYKYVLDIASIGPIYLEGHYCFEPVTRRWLMWGKIR